MRSREREQARKRMREAIHKALGWHRCIACSMWEEYQPNHGLGLCHVKLHPDNLVRRGVLRPIRVDDTCPEWQQTEVG